MDWRIGGVVLNVVSTYVPAPPTCDLAAFMDCRSVTSCLASSYKRSLSRQDQAASTGLQLSTVLAHFASKILQRELFSVNTLYP